MNQEQIDNWLFFSGKSLFIAGISAFCIGLGLKIYAKNLENRQNCVCCGKENPCPEYISATGDRIFTCLPTIFEGKFLHFVFGKKTDKFVIEDPLDRKIIDWLSDKKQ